MVANPSSPTKTVAEFISFAKANAGKLNMGSSGIGASSGLYGELFKRLTGIEMAAVQYRGVGVALPDLMSGRLDVIFLPVATVVDYVSAGKLRALGVTSRTRVGVLPDVPTIGESVPGYEAAAFTGIGAPADTPPEIVSVLNKHVNAALADAAFKGQLAKLGLEPFASTSAEFGRFIAEETEKWGKTPHAIMIQEPAHLDSFIANFVPTAPGRRLFQHNRAQSGPSGMSASCPLNGGEADSLCST